MKTKFFAALLIVPLLFTASCKKDEGPPSIETGRMTMRMTDAPSPFGYEEVNIDVQSVEVHFANGNWQTLHVTPRVYNILTLCNGVDTLIADEDLPIGPITSVRMHLGPNNSMRRYGTLYPLSVPSGEESGLKVEVHESIGTLPLNLFLDFDAGQSIVEEGNGSYHLKPVIHAFTTAHTGTVQGMIDVPGIGIAVSLSNSANTYTTYAAVDNGYFMMRGLLPGVYTATVYTTASTEIVFTNVVVTEAQTTNMGVLHTR